MGKKKTGMRVLRLALFLILIAVILYYSVEVFVARANTQKIVDSYYQTGQVKITLDDLTQRQIDILLAVEDPSFYNHHGVDFKTPGAGWTTIPQGLAKKFYFKNFKQGLNKIKQTLCARLALDPLVSKDTQLTLYLNIMYYGNGLYGLYDAAEFYFHKTVSELSEDEYIALIATILNPEELNIKDHPYENDRRVERIHKVLSSRYTPRGLFDIEYEGADKIG